MTPLKTLADDKTNVIVAGDNKQLGPIVHSALASALGLKTSYLARIMDRDVYSLKDNAAAGGRGVTQVFFFCLLISDAHYLTPPLVSM